jgi:hypothetical protein
MSGSVRDVLCVQLRMGQLDVHKKVLHDLCRIPNIVKAVKSIRL